MKIEKEKRKENTKMNTSIWEKKRIVKSNYQNFGECTLKKKHCSRDYIEVLSNKIVSFLNLSFLIAVLSYIYKIWIFKNSELNIT